MEYKRGKRFETHSERFPFLHTKQHKSLQKETGKQEHKLQKRRQKDLRKMTYCIHSKRNANLIHSVPGSFLAVPAAARGMGLAHGERQSPVGLGEEQRFDCRCSGTARVCMWVQPLRSAAWQQFYLKVSTFQIHLHVGEKGARILTEQRLCKFRHQDSDSKE